MEDREDKEDRAEEPVKLLRRVLKPQPPAEGK